MTAQNGFAESFHARLRDEFLNEEVFLSVVDAQVRLGVWRRYWNEERLHSSLGYRTPAEFAAYLKAGNNSIVDKHGKAQAPLGV